MTDTILTPSAASALPPNPFPGLRPFQEQDASVFFGRRRQYVRMLNILRREQFLAVVGTSGCGKSSLVRAGLIPELSRGKFEIGAPGLEWIPIVARPGGGPYLNLAQELVKRCPEPESPSNLVEQAARLLLSESDDARSGEKISGEPPELQEVRVEQQLRDRVEQAARLLLPESDDARSGDKISGEPPELREVRVEQQLRDRVEQRLRDGGPNGLLDAIYAVPGLASRNVLVVIDQFEEIFRFGDTTHRSLCELERSGLHDDALSFVNMLLATVEARNPQVFVALTMRSDSLGRCDMFPDLPESITRSQFLPPRMTEEQLLDAIRRPLELFHSEIEDAVVSDLLEAMGDRQDQLPIVQHALAQLWEYAAPAQSSVEPQEEGSGVRFFEIGGNEAPLAGEVFSPPIPKNRTPDPASVGTAPRTITTKHAEQCRIKSRDQQSQRSKLPERLVWVTDAITTHADAVYAQLQEEGSGVRFFEIGGNDAPLAGEVLSPPIPKNRTPDPAASDSPPSLSQRIARAMFCALSQIDNNQEPERRLSNIDEVAGIVFGAKPTPEQRQQVIEVADKFAAEGHNFVVRSIATDGTQMLDISHETLLRRWKRLTDWIKAEAEAAELYRDLRSIVRRIEGTRQAEILSESHLKVVSKWQEEFRPTIEWARRYDGSKSPSTCPLPKCLKLIEDSRSGKEAEWARIYRELRVVVRRSRDFGRTEFLTPLHLQLAEEWLRERMPDVAWAMIYDGATTPEASDFPACLQLIADSRCEHDRVEAERRANVEREQQRERERLEEARKLAQAEAERAQELAAAANQLAELQRLKTLSVKRWLAGALMLGAIAVALWLQARAAERKAVAAKNDAVKARSSAEASERLAEDAKAKALASERFAKHSENVAREERRLAERQRDLARRTLYAAHIRFANDAWDNGDIPAATRYFNDTAWDLRGWEHAHLHERFSRLKNTLIGHAASVNSVAYSPDGLRIVSGSTDKTVKVWDPATGKETLTLNGHSDSVNSVSFSPDGKRIVSGSDDNTLKVWDAATGLEILTFAGHSDRVWSVSFSPDGKRIVSGSDDNSLKVWDAATGQETLTLKGHTGGVTSVSFSPNAKRVVSGSLDNTLKVWDAATGQETLTLKGHSRSVLSVCFSPDGYRVVSGSFDNTLKVWDAATGQETLTLKGHSSTVRDASFSSDGKRLVSCSTDKTVKVWDAATGLEALTLQGQSDECLCASFSPSGTRIVSGSFDKTLRVWDATTGQETLTLQGHSSAVRSVSYSPDGKRFVSGSFDKTLKLWDAATGEETLTLSGHSADVNCVGFSPAGERIVSGSSDKTLKVWDAATGQETLTLKGHTGPIFGVSISPDAKLVASSSLDNSMIVWDLATGQQRFTMTKHSREVRSVRFSPNGKLIASGSDDSTIKICNSETGQIVRTISGNRGPIYVVAWSPDGRRIVGGGSGATLKVWDAETGQETLTLKGHSAAVFGVSFSPDGQRVISGSQDKTLKVWDAETGQEILTLRGHSGVVWDLAFSPDGQRILSGSGDKTIKLWDGDMGHDAITLNGHSGDVSSVSFSQDGKRIVSGSGEEDKHGRFSQILVWDAVTGLPLKPDVSDVELLRTGGLFAVRVDDRVLETETDHQKLVIKRVSTGEVLFTGLDLDGVLSPGFSPDGMKVVSGNNRGEVKVWLQAARSAPAPKAAPASAGQSSDSGPAASAEAAHQPPDAPLNVASPGESAPAPSPGSSSTPLSRVALWSLAAYVLLLALTALCRPRE